jgi:hypothetical protein
VLGQPALAAAGRAVAFGDSARWGLKVCGLRPPSQARKARCGLRPLLARVVLVELLDMAAVRTLNLTAAFGGERGGSTNNFIPSSRQAASNSAGRLRRHRPCHRLPGWPPGRTVAWQGSAQGAFRESPGHFWRWRSGRLPPRSTGLPYPEQQPARFAGAARRAALRRRRRLLNPNQEVSLTSSVSSGASAR